MQVPGMQAVSTLSCHLGLSRSLLAASCSVPVLCICGYSEAALTSLYSSSVPSHGEFLFFFFFSFQLACGGLGSLRDCLECWHKRAIPWGRHRDSCCPVLRPGPCGRAVARMLVPSPPPPTGACMCQGLRTRSGASTPAPHPTSGTHQPGELQQGTSLP